MKHHAPQFPLPLPREPFALVRESAADGARVREDRRRSEAEQFAAARRQAMLFKDEKPEGERLPARPWSKPVKVKGRRSALAPAPGLAPHPYSVGVQLGRSIRFAVPLPDIEAQLEQIVKGELMT